MILVVLYIFKLEQVPEQWKKTKNMQFHHIPLESGQAADLCHSPPPTSSLMDHTSVEEQGWERQTSLQQWQWSKDSPPKWQCDCESSLFLLLFCLCWGFGSSLWALLFYFAASHLKDNYGEFSASLRRGIFAALFVCLFAFQWDFAKATRINLLEEKKDESCILMVIWISIKKKQRKRQKNKEDELSQ